MTAALLLVFLSACVHVTWNYLVKSSGEKFATMFAIRVMTALIAVPIVLIVPPPVTVLPHLVATGLLHTVYTITLTRAYDLGEYSLVYPIARGLSPLLAAFLALGFLGETLPLPGWLLLTTAVIGLLIVGRTSAGDLGSAPGAVKWSIATATLIGAYTVVDASAVRITGNAISYISAAFLSDLLFMTPVFSFLRRRTTRTPMLSKADLRRSMAAAPLQLLAYGLVLSALRIAPVGFVTSIRETGVILSALVGWRLLGDSFGPVRVGATMLVAIGIAGMTVLLGN